MAWSPDGRYIAASRWAADDSQDETGIFVIPLKGGPPRPLTQTRAPGHDAALAFSPDGRQLAYGSCTPACDLYVLALDADLAALGPAIRLTTERRYAMAVSPGPVTVSRSSLAQAPRGASCILSRVFLDGRRPSQRIELAGLNAFAPSTSRSMDRLVFSTPSQR